jgi:hypothetical protein
MFLESCISIQNAEYFKNNVQCKRQPIGGWIQFDEETNLLLLLAVVLYLIIFAPGEMRNSKILKILIGRILGEVSIWEI